jgi:hypothetical protein
LNSHRRKRAVSSVAAELSGYAGKFFLARNELVASASA